MPLTKVDYDPFAAPEGGLTKVDYDPFTTQATPAAPAIARPDGFFESAKAGFKRALPETKSLLYGATGAVAGAVGLDSVRDWGVENYQRVQKEEVEPLQGQSGLQSSLKGETSFADWAGDTIGNFGGQALQSLAAAGAGALVGSAAPGAGTVGGAVTGAIARPMVKKLVGKEIAELVAKNTAKDAVGKAALRRAGMIAAPTALNIAQETGIGYTGRAEDAEKAGEELTQGDALRAIGWGVPAGLVDTAAEALTAARVLRGGTGEKLVKRVAAGAARGAVTEGATEGVQAVMERAGANRELTGDEAYNDYIENVAAGVLGGSVAGGGGSVRKARVIDEVLKNEGLDQSVGTSSQPTDTSEQDPFAGYSTQTDTFEPLSGVAAPLGGEIIPQQPAQAAQEPQTPAAQMAANMRMQAQIQRANAKTVLGRAAADATEMQADAVAADPFDLSDMGATPNDEAPADGFTRLGVIAQSLNLDPEAIVAAARADVGDDTRYSLDGLDDRILTIYAQSLAPTVQPAQAQDGFPSEGAGGSQPTPVQAPTVEAHSGQANPVEGGGLAVESPVAAGDEPALASVPAAGAQAQEVSTASNAYPQEGAETRAIAAPEQPEYDESEDILDSDITTPSGTPFTIRDAAERAAARHEGGRVFPVDGGFVVRVPSPQASSSGQSEAPQPVPGSREQGALAGQAQAAPAPAALPVQEDRAQDAQAVPGSGLAAAQTADSSPSPQATPAQDSPQARQAAREANVPADLLAKRDAATERLNAASAAMQQFPAGNMGLTPDAVKAAPEWKAAKIELDRATVAARNANAAVVKASKAKPAKAAPPAASGGIDEAAVRAAYNAAMQAKTGVTDFDYGRGTFGDLIVGALNRDPEVVESARSSLINDSNETGLRVFFQQAGMKMPRTQREQRAAFDAYIGVTPEQRAARDKAKADSKASQAADKAMKSARSGAASVSMHSPDGQSVDGATWVDGLVAEGYSIIVQRGAATYLAKRDGSGYKMPHKAIAAYARLAAKSATEAKPEATKAEQPAATQQQAGQNLQQETESAPAWHTPLPTEGLAITPDQAFVKEAPQYGASTGDSGAIAAVKAAKATPAAPAPQTQASEPKNPRSKMTAKDLREAEQARNATAPSADGGGGQAKTEATAKISDFGEKLEGNRKDLPPSLRDELSDDQIATQPISKIWPADAHEGIEDNVAAALAFAARQEIPAKPRVAHKLRAWVAKVKMLRDMVSDPDDAQRFIEQGEAIKNVRGLAGFFGKVRLLSQLPREHWKRVGEVGEYPNAQRSRNAAELAEIGLVRKLVDASNPNLGHGLFREGSDTPLSFGERNAVLFVPNPYASVQIDGKTHEFTGGKIDDSVINNVKRLLGEDAPAKPSGLTAKDFEIRQNSRTGQVFINRKADSEKRKLKVFDGKDAVKEARDYLKEQANVDALAAEWEAVKARDNVGKGDMRRDENRERVGPNRRDGKAVTEGMFAEAFGFRGVAFGNWVGQGAGAKTRQGMLNDAYDALLDLSDLLGIPSKAISLNGSLGLSLGARGSGAASAHFESDNLVINLTKTRGAGSLAHEWFHALDNYFARLRGGPVPFDGDQEAYRKNNFITYRPEPAWVRTASIGGGYAEQLTSARLRNVLKNSTGYDSGKSFEENAAALGWQRDPKHKEGVRPQVEAAFNALVEALNTSPMAARASSLDKKADGYWHRIIERGARSFENYVINKLAQRGWTNDYLANITDWKRWQELGKNEERYPYLRPEEEAPIIEAFDKLFDTIQSRETDNGNVALENVEDTGFYSAALRAVEEGKSAPKKGTAEQWKGWLDGAVRRGEMKQSERDWLGLDAWLNKQDKHVTREQLADFIRANEVKVEEVTLGETNEGREQRRAELDDWSLDDLAGEYESAGLGDYDETLDALNKGLADPDEIIDAILDAQLEQGLAEGGGSTKFSIYKLPGGENYRELLLTLPPKAGRSVSEIEREWNDMPVSDPRWQALADERQAAIKANMPSGKFQSSHFDQPNILAHVRFNERVDSDGKRVLFVQEIQSDWHQAGRKQGYAGQRKIDTSGWTVQNTRGSRLVIHASGQPLRSFPDDARPDADLIAQTAAEQGKQGGVPDAPFKATDDWAMLAFKRMVRMAAENGFDRIAWATGEQNAELFDLSKQIEGVDWDKATNRLFVREKGAGEFVWKKVADDATESKLSDYIGKDVAEKLAASQPDKDGHRSLTGQDIKVGGEGMKGFYDKILPSAVNKWAKKFGGKVGQASVNASTPQNPNAKWSREPILTNVHAIDLTPAMRDAALQGMPLFNREDSATEWLSYMEADESRTGGDFDADRLGLRGAVNAMLGKSGLRVEYLRGYAGLPGNLRNAVESRNAMGRKGQTAALYDPATKRVFVFTHVVRTPERAAWNAAHEIAGHDGLRKLLGKRLDEVLELADKNPTVAALADEIAVQRKLRGDQRLLAVEEALAELAAAVRTGDYGRIQEKYRITVPEGIRARIQQVVENFIRRLKELLQNRTGVVFKDADVRALLEHAWQAAQVDSAIGTPSSALESVEPSRAGNQGVEFTNGQEALTSRLAQWSASLRVGGSRPRAVAANAEGIGAVRRNAAGAAEQGDASREEIREQSARLIERAKAEGFYWPDDSPIVAALNALPADRKGGGAEHVAFIVGEGADRFVIRATDNGAFGHRADISPAQYLARLDDYSKTFPSMQARLIGVSESAEIEGHAVIWTAQPYVRGKKFASQSALSKAMAARGWQEDGYPGVPRFKHEDTGTIIEDAHTDNVFHDDNGDLYPFDVVVEALPAALEAAEDADDGGILESVESVGDALASAGNSIRNVKLPAGYLLADLFGSQDGVKSLHWWHTTVGTQFNLAKKSPLFRRVFDSVQNMVADISHYANAAMDRAPDILPKFDSIKDAFKKRPMSAADAKKVSDAVFQGTKDYTRDVNGDAVKTVNVSEAGIVWTREELASLFGMNAKQIGLYEQARAAIDRSLDDTAVTQMIRHAGEDGNAVRDEMLAAGNAQAAANILSRHLADQIKLMQGDTRSKSLQETADQVQEIAKQIDKLKAKGYAPLSRFGRYTVYRDGDSPLFLMFETQREANRAARMLREKSEGNGIKTGVMSQEQFKLFKGMTPETLELFGEMLGLDKTGNEKDDLVFQSFLKAAKSNRSALKRLIHRQGIEGYSQDLPRVLAAFLYSNARLAATNLHAPETQRAINDIPKEQGDLQDAAIKLNEYIVNPDDAGAFLSGFNFAQYLGGSIASAMVNMTQPLTMSFPWLSQYGGAWNAAKALGEAMRLVGKGGDTGNTMLDEALKRADADGHTQPQEVHQLQSYASGNGVLRAGDGTKAGDAMAKAFNAKARVVLAWGVPFSLAEQFNRRTTFIAAFNMATEQGMADPYGFAVNAVQTTQGIYNKANKPAWSRNVIGGMAFTFKTYSINYVEMLHRMWTQGGKEGKKGVLLAMGVMFLLSGAGGLPGSDDLDDLIDGVMQRMGYNFSSKQEREEFFASIFGEQGAKFMEHGLSAVPGMPIDVSGRLGMGNLIPSTGLFVRKADHSRDIAEIAGPTGDFIKRSGEALGQLAEGNLGASMLAIAPRAAANAWKGIEMANTGEYRDTRGRKVLETTGLEAASKFIGFQPASVAKVQQASGAVMDLMSNYRIVSASIADRWAKGIYEQDPGEVLLAQKELADWNAKNPDMPIRIGRNALRSRVRNLAMDRRQRLAKTTPRAVRGQVEEMLGDSAASRRERLRAQEEES